jgi:uncharacterized protein (TIGR02594 family)
MTNRRQFLTRISIAGIGIGVAPIAAWTQPRSQVGSDYSSAFLPALRPLGTNPPNDSEVSKGDQLILSSPKGSLPIEIMRYFADCTETNVQGEAFNAGWRDRWNPVIVRFFECGALTPSGDETAWCAACLNWVLGRSGFIGTCSSSSSSFRCAGKETQNPAVGDIAVFRHKDEKLARAGRGHVGLFISQSKTSITILGGNQRKAGHHAICMQDIDTRLPLVFHSFRSMDSLLKLADISQPCSCKPAVNRYCPSGAQRN